MLSFWRLTLLCGLFISPSYCLLDSLSPILGNVPSVLNEDTQVVPDKLQVLDQDLKKELEKLNLFLPGLLRNGLEDVGDLVGSTVNTLVSRIEKMLGLKILNSKVLKIKVELGSDDKNINLRVPVSVTIAFKLNPLSSELIKVKVGLDVLVRASIKSDAGTGVSIVVLGDCSSDSSTLSISLLDNLLGLQKSFFRAVDGLLKKLLPSIVEKQTCPVIKNLANLLDVSQVQAVISSCSIVFDEFPYNLTHG